MLPAREFALVQDTTRIEIELAPLQGLWTEQQYLRMTDQSNVLIEFRDGVLEVLPMPTHRHQAIVRLLLITLYTFLSQRGGNVLCAPLRLRIGPHQFREPDLVAVHSADDPRVADAYWSGADLVVEIVSLDDPLRDTVQKRSEYAAAGIPEYWIVDPRDESVLILILEADHYTEYGRYMRGAHIVSPSLSGFLLAADAVFDAK